MQLLGFKPYAKEYTFEPQIFRTIPVSLEENVEELQGASITETGDLVTMKGDTLIYNAASFRTAENANLGDLLKKMPGMVHNGRCVSKQQAHMVFRVTGSQGGHLAIRSIRRGPVAE